MHFRDPNRTGRRRGPSIVLSNLFSPVVRSIFKASIHYLSVFGCIIMKPIPTALQSVFKNVGSELS